MDRKNSYTPAEKRIFEEGQRSALRSILVESGAAPTYGEIIKKNERFLKFLKNEQNYAKLATDSFNTEIWEGFLQFSSYELHNYVMLILRDYQSRLKKAREIHAVNVRLLQQMTQLTIE